MWWCNGIFVTLHKPIPTTMADKYITRISPDYEVLDKHTGELLTLKYKRKVPIESFIMLFFSSFPELMELEGQKLKVLMMCWKCSSFSTDTEKNIIVNDKDFKAKVHEYEPQISDANIDNCFTIFVKRSILFRVCRGKYELNPQYFFKGKLSNRSKLMFSIEAEPQPEPSGKSVCMFSFNVYSTED